MPSLNFVLYLTCLFMGKMAQRTDLLSHSSVRQVRHLVSLRIGDNLTLHCFHKGDDSSWLFWYKQTLGQKPTLISSFYVYDTKITFYDEFHNNPRFRLDTREGANHLTVSNVDISDSATYYCANSYTFVLSFAEGTIVNVKAPALNIPALVHQSVSGRIQPGGSVTLNCTVRTGTCDGEYSIYWFRNNGESHPGIIYTNEDRNNQCERKLNAQTRTCVYNFQIEHLNRSHAGTYYCAVMSCGQIVFGNGTNIEIKHDLTFSSSVVYYLSGALISTTIMVVSLAFSVYKMTKRNHCNCTKFHSRSTPFTTNEEGCQELDLHYSALRINKTNRSSKHTSNTTGECFYSSVKQ